MAFYADLSESYDALFPASPALGAFFDGLLREGWIGRVADAGCGTGAQILHFAAAGLSGVAFDPDPSLVALARRKLAPHPSVRVEIGGFADVLRLVAPPVDLVLCLGNSLVHVHRGEAAAFVRDAAAVTLPSGGLLVQILNYERLRREGVTEFPKMTAEGGRISLLRRYVWEGPRRVRFRAELRLEGERGTTVKTNEITLHPMDPGELRDLFESAGFCRLRLQGDYAGASFSPDSEAVVCLGRKG